MSTIFAPQPGSSYSGPARYPDLINQNLQARQRSRGSYDQESDIFFHGGLPTPPGPKETMGATTGSYGGHPTSQAHTNGYRTAQPTTAAMATAASSSSHARLPSYSHTNSKQESKLSANSDAHINNKATAQAIASHLQIPESVSKSHGSLAEFAAEITCLFWFETAETLQYAEDLPLETSSDRGLVADASPTIGFRKWVTTILSTTQVGKNVILLSLMFIYRLKKFNPSVSGKRGSEFRLLTIALMLGNKFLDDNTYTNKTWAEVSGISVTEIHIMEVEFLSNMRYELYVSLDDWERWKSLLGRFGVYYEKAAHFQPDDKVNGSSLLAAANQNLNYKFPSPPNNRQPEPITNYEGLSNPLFNLPRLPPSPTRHQSPYTSDRKRSLEMSDSLPPAKRLQQLPAGNLSHSVYKQSPAYMTDNTPLTASSSDTESLNGSRIPPLPIPRISAADVAGAQLAPLNLPTSRAMASVYPVPTPTWSQPITPMSAMTPNSNGLMANMPPSAADARAIRPASAQTSPVNMYGPSTPTARGLSPSFFLTNRSSPYRPVRHVNTLLFPPPSAAMHNPVRNIDFSQMHYQPLGRPTERRTGVVPYTFPDGRPQSGVSTPTSYRPF